MNGMIKLRLLLVDIARSEEKCERFVDDLIRMFVYLISIGFFSGMIIMKLLEGSICR